MGEYVVQLPLYQDQTTTKTNAVDRRAKRDCSRSTIISSWYWPRQQRRIYATPHPGSVYRSVDLIDISNATNIAGGVYDKVSASVAPLGVLNSGITPATYLKFLDINDNAQLNRFGLHNGAPSDGNDLYEKWESIAVVPIGDRQGTRTTISCSSAATMISSRRRGTWPGQAYKDARGANVDTLVLVYRVTLANLCPAERPPV